ncbi:MAG: endonuclease domain-containing protein [Ignavibacteriaceae bacterium]|nr:endonuclease domain-containing protein [Ignavibacteriaceae bacterium]
MSKGKGLITNFRELPYNPKLDERAREMQSNSTKGEIKFWCELLRNKKSGYQFYRQKIIHHYIVDFYCAKLKLVVEIDGTSHNGKEEYDKERESVLKSLELKVLHFNDLMVLNNFHLVEKNFKEQITIREKELQIDSL